ncbi:hypothetical protein J2W32_004489 [Variovorax boronicumulans]|uniref:Uncharacterized protein n=1 Tax=Variovorax boronicumulans TaxID=436515 RepID=A0AAW8D6H5_9BURK|nr:hypothetical protein [Variovorax boronicumulans]MDQ0055431.1 hypothetical protein [Variovorax boronicumulans]
MEPVLSSKCAAVRASERALRNCRCVIGGAHVFSSRGQVILRKSPRILTFLGALARGNGRSERRVRRCWRRMLEFPQHRRNPHGCWLGDADCDSGRRGFESHQPPQKISPCRYFAIAIKGFQRRVYPALSFPALCSLQQLPADFSPLFSSIYRAKAALYVARCCINLLGSHFF